MNTKTSVVAVAAVLTALAVTSIASAQAIFLPPTYTWDQMETTNVPADARASILAPTRHRGPFTPKPYGQW